MNVLELMDSKTTSFSKTERRIYEGIKRFPEHFATNSITEIATHSGISKPALTRFAKKLGFNGYMEFQYQLNLDYKNRTTNKKTSLADGFSKTLKQVEEAVSDEILINLSNRITSAHVTYLFGYNLSRLPSEELTMALNLLTDFVAVHPQQDYRPMQYHHDDVMIVYSAVDGSSYKEYLRSLHSNKGIRPYMILITTNGKHPLRHNFDEVIVLPIVNKVGNDSIALSDTFAFLFFNELLMQKLKQDSEGTHITELEEKG